MKFSVDRVEGDIVVLENLETKEMLDVNINQFAFEVKDGNIVTYENGTYIQDELAEIDKRKKLRERLNKLRKELE